MNETNQTMMISTVATETSAVLVQINATEMTSSPNGYFHGNNASNSSDQPCTEDHDEEVELILHVVTFVGAGISIFGILLTLLSYIGFRKFQTKRTHIVMVNLCICLLVYFVSYLLSNVQRRHSGCYHGNDLGVESPVCITGAFVGHLAMLATWFWVTSYWFVVLVMYQRPMGGHISHFFLKAALPSYGLPFIIALVSILVVKSATELPYHNDMCFVTGEVLYWGLLLPFAISLLPVILIVLYILRGMLSTNRAAPLQRAGNNKRVKVHLVKLSIITTLTAIMILGSVIVPAIKSAYSGEHDVVSTVIFTLVSTTLGVMLMVLFCVHQDDIRRHWVEVLTGKKHPIHHNSLSRMKYDATGANYGSSRKSSTLTNRQPSLFVEGAEDDHSRKSSRIVPKEDTDMTTLNLIQIPGTPSPARGLNEEEKEEDAPEKRLSALEPIDEQKQLQSPSIQNGRAEKTSLLGKSAEDKKRRSDSSSSNTSRGKANKKSKRQRSQNQLAVPSGASEKRKEFKRRSFSSSSITDGLHYSKKKRESTISSDSIGVTDFA